MKPVFKLFMICLSILIGSSCSDDDGEFPKTATIKVIHLIDGEDHVIVKTRDNPINYAPIIAATEEENKAKVAFDAFKNFSLDEGISRRVEVVTESDTLNPIYSEALSLKGIHSLYLSGTSENVETLLLEDNLKQFTDSIVGIRFINLSKTSGPINISVVDGTSNLVTDLQYQSATDYIEFPAKKVDGSYTFELVDSSGNVSTTELPVNLLDANDVSVKKNFTLVIRERQVFGRFRFGFTRFNSYL